ncbi:MAG: cobalamin B12-binding domain-containing protein [Candidatus Brocadiae bacterium]|nr:cobalamin B12-binding domain-containing protein [Candidatus Brocadiia bacterium]
MKEMFKAALLDSDKIKAFSFLSQSFDLSQQGEAIVNLISDVLTEIGSDWEKGDIALSQIYMSSRICEEILDKILPENKDKESKKTNIAIVTLLDLHFLGRRVVKSFLRSSGIEILDFGAISSPQDLAEKAIQNNIQSLLISTLMYHAAIKVKEVRECFRKQNYNIKILVGGVPFIFDRNLWKEVDADAMGVSPADAIKILQLWKQE